MEMIVFKNHGHIKSCELVKTKRKAQQEKNKRKTEEKAEPHV